MNNYFIPIPEETLFVNFHASVSSFNEELWNKLLFFRNELHSQLIERRKGIDNESKDLFLLFLQENLVQYFGDVCYQQSSSTSAAATSKGDPVEATLPWKGKCEMKRKLEMILISLVFHLLFFQLNEKIDGVAFLYSFVGIYRGSFVSEALKLLGFPLETKKNEFSIVCRLFVPFSRVAQRNRRARDTPVEADGSDTKDLGNVKSERASMMLLKRSYRGLHENLDQDVKRIESSFEANNIPGSQDDARQDNSTRRHQHFAIADREALRTAFLYNLHTVYLNGYVDRVVPSLLLNGGIDEMIRTTVSSLSSSKKTSLNCFLSSYVVKSCFQKEFLSVALLGKNLYSLSFDVENDFDDDILQETCSSFSSDVVDVSFNLEKLFIDRLLTYLTPSTLPLNPMKRWGEFVASSVSHPEDTQEGPAETENKRQELLQYMRNAFVKLTSSSERKKEKRNGLRVPFIPRFKENNLLLMIIKECDEIQFGNFLVNLFPEMKYYLTLAEISPEQSSFPEAGKYSVDSFFLSLFLFYFFRCVVFLLC
jgi:hypothetical protein